MRRSAAVIIAILWLTAGGAAAQPVAGSTEACPSRPWTMTSIEAVPALMAGAPWQPEAHRRLACFGSHSITVTARAGVLMGVWPGVTVAAAFGEPLWLNRHPADADLGWSVVAWLPPRVAADPVVAAAFTDAWSARGWYRITMHVDDPAAAACTPSEGESMVDDHPVVFTPEMAVTWCRNEFVVDSISRVAAPPTDAATAAPAAPAAPLPIGAWAVALAACLLVGGGAARRHQRG